jgi:hypothetical protein
MKAADMVIIRLFQRANGTWFSTIEQNGKSVLIGSDRENKNDAMLEATCWLNNKYPKQ